MRHIGHVNFLKAFEYCYVLPILVTISADILVKLDCCTVHGLTLLYEGSKMGSRACLFNSVGLNDQVNRDGVR
jgi:hypothetical protein